MRWAPLHPRQLLAIALSTLALAFCLMLAAAPDLGTLEFPVSGAGESDAPAVAVPAPGEPVSTGQPTWVTDPLSSPLAPFETHPPERPGA